MQEHIQVLALVHAQASQLVHSGILSVVAKMWDPLIINKFTYC